MAAVRIRYWAGARAAAGTAEETIEAPTLRAALQEAASRRDAHFVAVLGASSLLVEGVAARDADLDLPRTDPVQVEVLPPFAGGASRDDHYPDTRTSN